MEAAGETQRAQLRFFFWRTREPGGARGFQARINVKWFEAALGNNTTTSGGAHAWHEDLRIVIVKREAENASNVQWNKKMFRDRNGIRTLTDV